MKRILLILLFLVWFIDIAFGGIPTTEIGESKGDIKFFADPVIFWKDNQTPYTEIYYQIPYEELQFIKNEAGTFSAKYEISSLVYDDDDNQLTGKLWKNEVKLDTYQETEYNAEYVIGLLPLDLPGDTRKIMVKLEDLVSGEKAEVERELEEEYLSPGKVLISELVFASNIEPVIQDSLFRKGDLNVTPNPPRLYGDLLTDLFVYYELYDLSEDKDYQAHCEVLDRRNNSLISQTVRVDSTSKEQYVRINIKNFSRGNYTFVLTISHGNTEVKRAGEFRVLQSIFTQDYDITLQQIRYIASHEEYKTLKNLPPEDRLSGLIAFWQKRDPTPTTTYNEALLEFYRRIRYANQKWDTYIPGWKTDRGRIYIKYGPPDDIEYHPFERGLKEHWVDIPASMETATVHAYQIWNYYSLEGHQQKKEFIFIDFDGRGEYELYNVTDEDR